MAKSAGSQQLNFLALDEEEGQGSEASADDAPQPASAFSALDAGSDEEPAGTGRREQQVPTAAVALQPAVAWPIKLTMALHRCLCAWLRLSRLASTPAHRS